MTLNATAVLTGERETISESPSKETACIGKGECAPSASSEASSSKRQILLQSLIQRIKIEDASRDEIAFIRYLQWGGIGFALSMAAWLKLPYERPLKRLVEELTKYYKEKLSKPPSDQISPVIPASIAGVQRNVS